MILRNRSREFVPIVLLFVIVNALFISGRSMLAQWNVDQGVVIGGNLLLFSITFFSFLVAKRGLQAANPHAFTRSIYSSILIKLFICAIAAFVYIFTYRTNLNKPALFTCMALYLIYTFLEVYVLTKLLRGRANG